ncbi:hypothetical protein NQS96_13145 [Pseudoalteromonas shioyasakiensis]|nr:hypothetical protein [Pseudoalteromonas shioyasakiensis]MCQ8882720.1 hypothetical protein [Pseudoalteromonas shioyasakiensis]
MNFWLWIRRPHFAKGIGDATKYDAIYFQNETKMLIKLMIFDA